MHRKTYWRSIRASSNSRSVPKLPGPDIVEPVAAAATTPAAFAEAARLVAFDAETEDCFALFVEIIGENL